MSDQSTKSRRTPSVVGVVSGVLALALGLGSLVATWPDISFAQILVAGGGLAAILGVVASSPRLRVALLASATTDLLLLGVLTVFSVGVFVLVLGGGSALALGAELERSRERVNSRMGIAAAGITLLIGLAAFLAWRE